VLIIPFRHLPSYFDTTHNEKLALIGMIEKCRMLTEKQFQPDGYNIGVNIGESAGQTIMHLHIHMIPRYLGDIADPRGGVRGAIPDKRIY
jgi:diadenosine tetraphosphate (Ap4A) HIT family hydrolase